MNIIITYENGIDMIKIYTYGNNIEHDKNTLIEKINKSVNLNKFEILEGYIFINSHIHTEKTNLREVLNWNSRIFYSIDDAKEYYENNFKNLCFTIADITKKIRVYEELNLINKMKSIKEKDLMKEVRKSHNECIKNRGCTVNYFSNLEDSNNDNESIVVCCNNCNKLITG